MKSIEQVLADVGRRLARTWAADAAAGAGAVPSDTSAADQGSGPAGNIRPSQGGTTSPEDPARAWPHQFSLGQVAGSTLAADFSVAAAWSVRWRRWAADHQAELRFRTRRVLGTDQELPTHLSIGDIDQAAHLCAGGWPDRLARGRHRASSLADRFPRLQDARLLAATVNAVDQMSDVDFDVLCRAGEWFTSNDATGLTPRQVPIEGLHAKWLNTRQELVRRLCGRESLGLLPPHPPRVHFTYLDPDHLAAGRRRHDSVTIGDTASPMYLPQIVVISENKDTAIHFPPLTSAISVEGMGRGAGAIAALPWLTAAQHVFYWGDMDADGLEILNEFRAAGVPATSLFMDMTAFDRWGHLGTNEDRLGKPLSAREQRPVPFLTTDESTLYAGLTSQSWGHHRRVEQERIPLVVALSQVKALTAKVPYGLGDGISGGRPVLGTK
ncbi:Wadjet anti-phage system protein JetD domain-containing protein [Actinoplanes sp. NPDC020271]|uniref:Wadjet anti-phage system protein JetD domain-containing protein n=1 Tax=Actinoplanes sp. NPDC020271 TaxID=3363896 RepID=UPI0037889D3E